MESKVKNEIKIAFRSKIDKLKNNNAVIGILGGMGPEASLDFERYIFELSPARNDQENFKVLHFSNPNLPDRTAAFNQLENNPELAKKIIKETVKSINLFLSLNGFNCKILAVPCNTISYFFDDIKLNNGQLIKGINSYFKNKNLPFKILTPVKTMADFVCKNTSPKTKIGLLSTSATLKAELYQKEFKKRIRKITTLEESIQEKYVSPAITLIKERKKKEAEKMLKPAIEFLENRGVGFTVLGCTELPLVLKGNNFLNSTLILAGATILNMLKLI